MNPLRGLVIINSMLKDYRATILNHGFGEHCLPFLLDFWTFEAKGSRAWKSLECVLIHDALSDGDPNNIFWDRSSVVLCAQGYHWTNSYVILLATQFRDPRLQDHGALTPLEKFSVVCGVRVRTAVYAELVHRECGFLSQLWKETLQGPYAKRE